MATDMMELDRPTIPSDPWENEHNVAAGVNKLVDDQTDTTTNEKRSTTTTPQLELAKRQKPDDYIPDERLVAFNNGIISSSSSVAPFKNSGGRPDWEYGWLGASVPPPRDPNHYKLLDGDKAAEYKSVRDRLYTLVKLSVGISDDMINKVPPLRSDKEYTNQDTATDAFLLLMARMSLDDIPPEQRKEEARRLLGVVSNLVEDCDINAFFRGGGGGGGGGDLVVPSAALSTGGINSTSDEELTESNTPTDGTNAAVPSSCTTPDAVIDNKDDLVLSVASCPEGNNSSTDDELLLASNSELRATEEISSMDEGTSTSSSVVVEEREVVYTQEEVEFEPGSDWQSNDLVAIGSDVTTSVPTSLTNHKANATWRRNIIQGLHDIDEVIENVDSFSQLKTKERLLHYSSINQIKVQQITLLYADHYKQGISSQELKDKILKVLDGYVYYEKEFDMEMHVIRKNAKEKIAEQKKKEEVRISALFAVAEKDVAKKHPALVAKMKSNREKAKVEKARREEERKKERLDKEKKLFEEKKERHEQELASKMRRFKLKQAVKQGTLVLITSNSTTGYKGVTEVRKTSHIRYHRNQGTDRVTVVYQAVYKTTYLGIFDNLEDAAMEYALAHFNETT